MVALAGYEDFIQIHDGANSQVYRARRIGDRLPVILKFLKEDYPTPEQIRRYKQEYYLTRQLDSPSIIKAYQLEEWQRGYAIALEDFGAISLKQWLKELERLSLPEFLLLAIAITKGLAEIHDRDIIHKDINPSNIVLNPETKELKIIDFGISSQLSRENTTLKNPNFLEGTLAYISPEQTGRMNRSLDYRTDFYSLGATFYEMLAGKLPFEISDALELVHCHIAKMPTALGNGEEIPPAIAAIVIKLMAKNAEDRYQSASGLKADLETCLNQLEQTGSIALFSLGRRDISDRFQIPQKLYGRQEEIATLLAAFERVASGQENPVAETGKVELMLVAGYSGIGKSSLVQELYKPITASRGYFIAGKFDQFQGNIPYSAIVAAFRGLFGQLLGESEARLQLWREKILQALGNSGQIIIDIVPELELIIGKQPPVPALEPDKAQNRFNLVMGNFINVFCAKEHPLTLFLDDLQWVDLATLQLMERILLEGRTESLLFLGAYRDNEVSIEHPLTITLAKLQQNNAKISKINLKPLPLDCVSSLIGDTLLQTPETARDLAELVLQKTGGNPFFINSFLQALHDEELLRFDRQARNWQWDLAAIESRGFTDNVVDLMVGKLQQLAEFNRKILSLAACLGGEFDLTILAIVAEKSPPEIFAALKIALDRYFILPISELDENLLIQSYKFAHDRMQQAAYTLIPEGERAEKHIAIGRILLENTPEGEREDKLFDIVDQLDRGMALLSDSEEREEVARLNLQAGCKAREANAYGAAIAYFDAGISMLDENSWQTQYELTLSLYQEATKAAYLNAESERMEALADIIAKEAKTARDRLELGKTKIDAYSNQGRFCEAVAVGLETLADLGIEFPPEPSQEDFAPALAKVQKLVGERQPATLANLPDIQDPLMREALGILVKILGSSSFMDPALFTLTILKQVELSITYGNAPASAMGYASYGLICCGVMEDFTVGYQYGQLAFKILSRFNNKQFEAAVAMLVYSFLYHWKTHLREGTKPCWHAFLVALEIGELQYSGYVVTNYCSNLYLTGRELAETSGEFKRISEMLQRIDQKTSINQIRPYWQAVLNLQGQSDQTYRLVGRATDEKSLIADLQNNKNEGTLGVAYIVNATLCYLFEELSEAAIVSASAQQYLKGPLTSHYLRSIWNFYNSLTQLAVYHSLETSARSSVTEFDFSDREALLSVVRENQAKMKLWAESAPMNYLHKFYLVEAEYHRAIGKKVEAIEFYNSAITKAKENEYIQEEALANELTAKFYLDWGQETAARAYMTEARYCYSRWGAMAKVRHLEENYPQLFPVSTAGTSTNHSDSISNCTNSSTSSSNSNLDIATFIKASQAIAREILLSQLLTQLIKVLLENTGAQWGFLILETEGELLIEAEAGANGEIAVLQSMPLEFVKPDGSLPELSSAIVNYVARTHDSVVLNDARNEGNFTTQTYIQNFQVKSVLCVPLVNQGQLRGIVYLENNLTTGAFTEERVEIVQLLSGQAAISISNAQLYTEVKQSEQRLQQFLEAIPIGVSIHAPNGQLHYANRTAQQLLGINIAPEAKTEEIAEAYQVYRAGTQELYPNEQLPLVRSLAGETVKTDDLELRQPDKTLPLEVSSRPILDETGKVVYGIAAFQDITERKQAEKLLVDYNKSLEKQLALSLENTQLYEASKRFVPDEFLSILENKSIIDVKLGDRVEREMTVLFSDIRDFTTISEQMNPEENFAFINEYLGFMEPPIQKYGGFIDKYIGDAIMALFANSADDAVKGSIAMLEELKKYNSYRQKKNIIPIRIGIGLHTGRLMLGTVGGLGRMDGTVIGDAVNLSSRVEGLTKTYGVSLLITYATWQSLNNPLDYEFRFIDKVKAKGKTEAVGLLEVFSADPPELKSAKMATKTKFEKAVLFYHSRSFQEAANLFQECLDYHSGDRAARIYLDRCLKS